MILSVHCKLDLLSMTEDQKNTSSPLGAVVCGDEAGMFYLWSSNQAKPIFINRVWHLT